MDRETFERIAINMYRKHTDVKLKRLHKDAKIPVYSSEYAAGADLFSIEDVSLHPNELKLVKTGWAMEVHPNVYIEIFNRGSMSAKRQLVIVSSRVVDADYRGEVFVPIKNIGEKVQLIKKGDKIAQMMPKEVVSCKFEEVDELSETERNTGGFGSTGR
jgi:dUTP pyrophosphatase